MDSISKISVATCDAQPKIKSLEPKERRDLLVIYGTIRGYKVGTSSFGEYVKFHGAIEARNVATGELFSSQIMILPNNFNAQIQDAVDALKGKELDFGIVLGVMYAKNNRGYEYTVSSFIETKESDALTALRAKASAAFDALSPKTAGDSAKKK